MKDSWFPCFMASLVGVAQLTVFALAWSRVTPEMVSNMALNSSDLATLISGFGGAVLGAIVGGVVSWVLARQAAREARLERRIEQNHKTAAALMRLQLKTLELTNASYTIARWINEPLEKVQKAGGPTPLLWQLVQPVASTRSKPNFETSDFLPLVHPKGADLINRISFLDDRYAASACGVAEYSRLHREFSEFAAPYSRVLEDGRTEVNFPDEKQQIALIKTSEMDRLINQIKASVEAEIEDGKIACAGIRTFAAEVIEIDVPFLNVDFTGGDTKAS